MSTVEHTAQLCFKDKTDLRINYVGTMLLQNDIHIVETIIS